MIRFSKNSFQTVLFGFFVASITPVNAETVSIDISNLAGFTFIDGGAGGYRTSISPAYTFQEGDTIDFGTAILGTDPACFFNNGGFCLVADQAAEVAAWFLTNGEGAPSQGDILGYDIFGRTHLIECPDRVNCGPPLSESFALIFGLPSGANGIEFAFYGWGLEIDPPANTTATPLPAALPLFATGLGVVGLLGWCRKRKTAAPVQTA